MERVSLRRFCQETQAAEPEPLSALINDYDFHLGFFSFAITRYERTKSPVSLKEKSISFKFYYLVSAVYSVTTDTES